MDKYNNNSAETVVETSVAAHKKDLSALPKVRVASIRPLANKGTLKEGTLTTSAFYLNIGIDADWTDAKGRVHKAGEYRPEAEWVVLAGQKTTKRVYSTVEKARAAKDAVKAEWSVPVEKKAPGKRPSAMDKAVAVLMKSLNISEEEARKRIAA